MPKASATMYEAALDQAWGMFADHLQGQRLGTFLVVSARPLHEAAQTACRNSARALGYGDDGAVVASLEAFGAPDSLDASGPVDSPDGSDRPDAQALDPRSLFALVEGIDPLCLVCADRTSAEALSAGYRCPLALGERASLLGRPFVAFDDFESLMETDRGKQEAWALLRTLPKFGER